MSVRINVYVTIESEGYPEEVVSVSKGNRSYEDALEDNLERTLNSVKSQALAAYAQR